MSAPSIAPPVSLGFVPVPNQERFIDIEGNRYKITVLYRKAGSSVFEDITSQKDWRTLAAQVAQIHHEHGRPFERAEAVVSGDFNNIEETDLGAKELNFVESKVSRKEGAELRENSYHRIEDLRAAQPEIDRQLADIGNQFARVKPIYRNVLREDFNRSASFSDDELRIRLNRHEKIRNALAHAKYDYDILHFPAADRTSPTYGADKLRLMTDAEFRIFIDQIKSSTQVDIYDLLQRQL